MYTKEIHKKIEDNLKDYIRYARNGYMRGVTSNAHNLAIELWEEIKEKKYNGSKSCSRCIFNLFRDLQLEFDKFKEEEEQNKGKFKKTKKTKKEE